MPPARAISGVTLRSARLPGSILRPKLLNGPLVIVRRRRRVVALKADANLLIPITLTVLRQAIWLQWGHLRLARFPLRRL